MKTLYIGIISMAIMAHVACSSCSGNKTEVTQPDVEYTVDVEYYNFSPRVPESQLYAVKVAGEFIKVFPTYEPHLAWFGVAAERQGRKGCGPSVGKELQLQDRQRPPCH